MIKPIITLLMSDGSKKKIEYYTRPPALTVTLEDEHKDKKDHYFIRCGPDEYMEKVKWK